MQLTKPAQRTPFHHHLGSTPGVQQGLIPTGTILQGQLKRRQCLLQ
jgi:hypothetical protein